VFGKRGWTRWRAPRFFLVARLAFIAAAPAPLLFGFAPTSTALQRTLYASGLLIIALATLLVFRQRDRRDGLSKRLLDVLPVLDLVGLTAMGLVASRGVPDPLYPVFVILPVLYALLLPKRRALVLACLAAVAYAATTRSANAWHYYAVLVHIERIACIPTVTLVVAMGAEIQRRQVERLQLVAGVAEAVHASLDAEFLSEETVATLAGVLGIRSWRLCVVEGLSRQVVFEATAGLDGVSAKLPPVIECLGGIASGSTEGFDPGRAHASMRVLVDDYAEVVFCGARNELHHISAEDRLVLQAVARELLVAIENRRLYGITKHLSLTDELTGLYNRRHLTRRILEEIGRARRFGGVVSLLMLDGDDFKRVNDAHGHHIGDEVLAELAKLMLASVRDVDVVARFGGEEFCILLPETEPCGALTLAEKLCETVRRHHFPDGVRLSVSVGVATFPDDVDTAEALQQAADDALYRAKAAGKGRVAGRRHRQDFAS